MLAGRSYVLLRGDPVGSQGEKGMEELTQTEERALAHAARRVHAHKLMQAKGYERLAARARDDRARKLMMDISANETEDAQHWVLGIEELAAARERAAPAFLTSVRVRLMMGILGVRGFFEWAVIAEDESVGDLAILAANLADPATSAAWTRRASDERLHIERIKKQVLGMEGWEMGGGGGVRDVIFGANDGLVSILALLAGVYGAVTESRLILIAGVAGAVAGAISMGAGAYLSSKSELEVTEKESERKGIRRRRKPEEEKAELVRFYQARGFEKQEAAAIASRVRARMEVDAEYTVGEELGLTSEEAWPPWKAAVLTGLSFAIASVVPILPFAIMEVTPAAITAAVASTAALFAVGASKATFTRKSWVTSGLEMMAIGTVAAAATYAIGLLIPE
jgi:VIT1/CCC1 family predicted Fe2+/Mn2+ transporter